MSEKYHDAHDVEIAISNGLITHFNEIPQPLQSAVLALKWFNCMATAPSRQSIERLFCQVPAELFTQELLMAASDAGVNILGHIDLRKDNNYASVGLSCMRKNYKNLSSLDPHYRDLAAQHLAWNSTNKVHLIAREFPWFRDHLAPGELTRCCINMDFALDTPDLPADRRRSILLNGEDYDRIRAHGRLDLLADQIAEGEWPQRLSKSELPGPRPTSLEEGMHWISQCRPDSNGESLHMAYLMTHPMDQVVPLMRGRRLKKLLIEMYPPEALRPYLSRDNELKGAVLEDALGL
jgi:hypothetical protein